MDEPEDNENVKLFDKNAHKGDGMSLSWHNLTYKIQCKYDKNIPEELAKINEGVTHYDKQILYEQSGYASPGEALFIMGASGAGKSSLLNCICSRLDYKGQVLVNKSLEVNSENYGRFGAYVTQDDVLYATLTCKESIAFAAKLRLGLNDKETQKEVENVIYDLGLNACKDTLVGSNLIRGLSGGERKRTAIGVELITNPSVILLDEPTSGLDSFNAHKIVKILTKQARKGKTVIATIHQPNSTIFNSFDRLLLLMEGRCIYQGPSSEAVPYFSRLNFVCPEEYNPADYFLQQFSVPKAIDDSYYEKINKLDGDYRREIDPTIQTEIKALEFPRVSEEQLKEDERYISWCTELKVLLHRHTLDILRNPLYLRVRLIQSIVIALLTLTCFWDLGYNEEDTRSKAGFIFFICSNQTILNFFGTLLSYIREKEVFIKEYKSKTYGVTSYYLAKSI